MINIPAKIPKRKIKTIGIISGIVIFTLLASGIIASFVDREKKIPYLTVNGYAENEEDYDPGVTLLLDMNEELLSSIDSKFGLIAVWQRAGTDEMVATGYDGYNEPQPETGASFEIQSSLIFKTEEEAKAALDFAFAYYTTNAYEREAEGSDSGSPYKRTEQIEANNTQVYEQAKKQYDAGSDIIVPSTSTIGTEKGFNLDLSADVLYKLLGKPATPPVKRDYIEQAVGQVNSFITTRNYDSSNNQLPEDEYTYVIHLKTKIRGFQLANLPKFEGNFRFTSELGSKWWVGEKYQEGLPCPLEPNSIVGGWLPAYGCPPN